MNKHFSILLLLLLCACSATISRNDAIVHFTQNEHDFGSLPFKEEAEFSFEFSNPGETPLTIYDVKTTCGCTAADWTKKPVKPGGIGKITMTYDAAFPGAFHKEISVFYSGPDSPAKLEIKGQVEYPDEMLKED